MDMLDWVLVKTNQRVAKFYEESLGDNKSKITGVVLDEKKKNHDLFHKLTNNYLSFTLSVSILGLIGKQWIIFYEFKAFLKLNSSTYDDYNVLKDIY